MNKQNVNNSQFWDEKYKSDNTAWDLKSANPVFIKLIEENIFIKPCKLLITGAGKSYDAVAAAKKNYDVTAVDFSKEAIEIGKKNAKENNVEICFLNNDIFKIPSSYNSYFDAIFEYTTYCAISPERREEYAEVISSLLKPEGTLIALLFPIDGRPGGPPFNIDVNKFEIIFSKNFNKIYYSNKIDSVKSRKGKEVLHIYKKK